MPSLRSLIQQLGATSGLILAGAIADVFPTSTARMIGAIFFGCRYPDHHLGETACDTNSANSLQVAIEPIDHSNHE